jgi:DMSO/TMAO reductase YedYZ heme-binding membrane subunit
VAEGLQLLNRYLARAGFLLFLPIYAASPLVRLAPGPATRALVRSRRSVGLAYALVMAAHLTVIVAWYATPEIPLEPDLSVIGGGLGMLLIGALAATSNDAAVRRLGRRAWRLLHGLTLHFLWLIYAVTYLGRVTEGAEYWPGLAATLALPGLRLAARLRGRPA